MQTESGFLLCLQKNIQIFYKIKFMHIIQINEVWDYLEKIPNEKIKIWKISLKNHSYFPIKTFTEVLESTSNEVADPYSSLTSAISRAGKYTLNTVQINFEPEDEKNGRKIVKKL